MDLLSSSLITILIISMPCQGTHGEKGIQNRTLSVGDKLSLTSPSFPECCLKDFAYYIYCKSESCAFNVLFIDVDLPKLSSLEVYDGRSSQAVLLTSARHQAGVWSRPSLVVTSNSLSIVLTVHPHQLDPSHAGVKVHIEAFDPVVTQKTSPLTSVAACGSVNLLNDWKGGEIKLTPATAPVDPSSNLDCIWVLKTPPQFEDVRAFIRFTDTTNLHGILEVRGGTNSASPELLLYLDARHGHALLMSETEGYKSRDGLYVRLRKPLVSGSLTFVYGLFSNTIQNVTHGTCELTSLDGEVRKGFYCSDFSWCIPALDRCDGVKHCGTKTGDDEKDCTGTSLRTSTTHAPAGQVTEAAPTGTSLRTSTTHAPAGQETEAAPTAEICWAWQKNCPDGSCIMITARCPGECWPLERRCSDGNCLLSGIPCPGECRTWETKCPDGSCILDSVCPKYAGGCAVSQKRCNNGTCIDKTRLCDEDECPEEAKYRCGDQCYGEEEKCDDTEFCDDGSDEKFCSISSMPLFSIMWVAIPGLMCIIMLTIVAVYTERQKPVQLDGGRRPPPIVMESSSQSRLGILEDSESLTMEVSDSMTTPLTKPQPPPPYSEDMEAAYSRESGTHRQPAPNQSLPPSYEEAAAAYVMPPKTG